MISSVSSFVTQFNILRDKINELTFFNETDNKTGVLFGSNETLRIETELASLLTGRFFGVGSIQSLEAVGVKITDTGKLSFDSAKLEAKYAADPQAVEEFFSDEKLGVSAKFNALIETLAGEGSSLLVTRAQTLQSRIDINVERISFLEERLTRQRDQLLKQFYNMELAIGKLQSNLTALDSIQVLAPL